MATQAPEKLTKDERMLIVASLKQAHASATRGVKAARSDKMREAWQDEADKLNNLMVKIVQKELDL